MRPETIREQALQLRGADLTQRRSEELAADMERIVSAVSAVRENLDFNDEPARFAALLDASARVPSKR